MVFILCVYDPIWGHRAVSHHRTREGAVVAHLTAEASAFRYTSTILGDVITARYSVEEHQLLD